MDRVLVVDDERDIRMVVSEILSEEGYQVAGAEDGAAALTQLYAFRPQLVLLDLMMPRMDGWEFRRAQRSDPEVCDIPVLVLSALGRQDDLEVAGYIDKPFALEELLSAVRLHASRRAA